MDVLGPFEVLKRPLTLSPKDAKPPATGGPVAWWKLDESGGSEAADASGQRHPARMPGVARWTPGAGRIDGALELDGVEDYLDVSDSADFDFRNGFTASLWLKLQESGRPVETLIAKGSDTWRVQSDRDAGLLVFALNGPQTTGKDKKKPPQVASKRKVDDGRWHQVTGVYDGRRMALFLDGQLEDSVSASGPLALNTEPVWLGNNAAARSECFHGWLDDVRLYGRALNDTEIKALYDEAGR